MALTDTEICRSKPAQKSYRLFDSRGLHIFVTPTGGKHWRWKYCFRGKEKQMGFGHYPAVSLADARVRRDSARRKLADGIDPMAERTADKIALKAAAEHTFEKVAELWLEHWRGNKSARHAATTENRLKINVYPSLGNRPIADVEPMELTAYRGGTQSYNFCRITRL